MNINIAIINKICFTICILAIILGLGVGMLIIWTDLDREWFWKSFLSLALLFFASLTTLSVTKVLGNRTGGSD